MVSHLQIHSSSTCPWPNDSIANWFDLNFNQFCINITSDPWSQASDHTVPKWMEEESSFFKARKHQQIFWRRHVAGLEYYLAFKIYVPIPALIPTPATPIALTWHDAGGEPLRIWCWNAKVWSHFLLHVFGIQIVHHYLSCFCIHIPILFASKSWPGELRNAKHENPTCGRPRMWPQLQQRHWAFVCQAALKTQNCKRGSLVGSPAATSVACKHSFRCFSHHNRLVDLGFPELGAMGWLMLSEYHTTPTATKECAALWFLSQRSWPSMFAVFRFGRLAPKHRRSAKGKRRARKANAFHFLVQLPHGCSW